LQLTGKISLKLDFNSSLLKNGKHIEHILTGLVSIS